MKYFRDNKKQCFNYLWWLLSKQAVAYRQNVFIIKTSSKEEKLIPGECFLFAFTTFRTWQQKCLKLLVNGSLTALTYSWNASWWMFLLIFQLMLFQLTDGQIFLETEFCFIEVFDLQINAGLSVSTRRFCSSIKKQCDVLQDH